MSARQHDRSNWLAGMLFVAAIAASLAIFVDAGLSLPVYLLASAIVMFDGVDIVVRLFMRHNANRRQHFSEDSAVQPRPFAICLAVYNIENEIDTLLENLGEYRSNAWIIDDASTDATVLRMRAAGWRVISGKSNRKKPASIHNLLKQLPAEIRTVLVMDPDVRLPGNLAERVCAFQKTGAAAMCPKVTVRSDGSLAELQHIEYALSFDLGRHSLTPQTVTSGVALYDRRALDDAMQQHSLSVYGEDLENAVVLLGSGQDIIYDPTFIVETEGKPQLASWFSQRVGWSFSLLKVCTEHFADIRRIMRRSPYSFYQFGIYFMVMSILLWPIKIVSVVVLAYSALNGIDELLAFDLITNNRFNHPGYFAALYVKYTFLIAAAYVVVTPTKTIPRGLLFVPFFFLYCIALVIPTGIGYLNWITLRLFGLRIYDDHYDSKPVLGRQHRYV